MRTCTVEGCTKNHYGLGWCKKHYTRVRRHGNTWEVHLPGKPQDLPPSVIPVGWLPPDAGEWMPYSEQLRFGRFNLYLRDASRTTVDEYTYLFDDNGQFAGMR